MNNVHIFRSCLGSGLMPSKQHPNRLSMPSESTDEVAYYILLSTSVANIIWRDSIFAVKINRKLTRSNATEKIPTIEPKISFIVYIYLNQLFHYPQCIIWSGKSASVEMYPLTPSRFLKSQEYIKIRTIAHTWMPQLSFPFLILNPYITILLQ